MAPLSQRQVRCAAGRLHPRASTARHICWPPAAAGMRRVPGSPPPGPPARRAGCWAAHGAHRVVPLLHHAPPGHPAQRFIREPAVAGGAGGDLGAAEAVHQLLLGQVQWEGGRRLLVLDQHLGLHGRQGRPGPARPAAATGRAGVGRAGGVGEARAAQRGCTGRAGTGRQEREPDGAAQVASRERTAQLTSRPESRRA